MYRYVPTFMIAILLGAAPLRAATPPLTDAALSDAADKLRLKNYSAASRTAADAREGGKRDLLRGVAELKRGNASAAAPLLAAAAKGYPLLADYALAYQIDALTKLEKTAEALAVNTLLVRDYPESTLARSARLRQGDLLFAAGDFGGAEAAYQKFVETYASGSDAIQASYRTALCREKRGDLTGAAAILRTLWLASPASHQAARAEEDLARLAAAGVPLPPYTPKELLKRGSSLYDQNRYEAALKTFRAIDAGKEPEEFRERLSLKIGQSLLKTRKYADARAILDDLASRTKKKELAAEAAHLAARCLEKGGKDDEAFDAYRQVAARYPDSSEAESALLNAAFVRKFQRRPADAATVLTGMLETYPRTRLKQRTSWELGWSSYLAGDLAVAEERFAALAGEDGYRERALYWLGRTRMAAKKPDGAAEAFTTLAREFPFGFYTLQYLGTGVDERKPVLPKLGGDPRETLPMPEGFERVKALTSLGLIEDAGREIAAAKKKNGRGKNEAGMARLYLEMGDYFGALALYQGAAAKNGGPDNPTVWGILYPRAYPEQVSRAVAENRLSTGLAYGIMKSESSFKPGATSPVGARGLMQLMPDTAASMLKVKSVSGEKLYDPELNIRLGIRHLRDLLDQYQGNQVAVIASYNAGGGNVNRWLKTYAGLREDEFIESIPFGETRDYVKKVLATAVLYRQLYGMD